MSKHTISSAWSVKNFYVLFSLSRTTPRAAVGYTISVLSLVYLRLLEESKHLYPWANFSVRFSSGAADAPLGATHPFGVEAKTVPLKGRTANLWSP